MKLTEKVLTLSQILPGDIPRNISQSYISTIWGQDGPAEKIIDLTSLQEDESKIYIIEVNDGHFLCAAGNNRLWYLASRCNKDQEIKVNVIKEDLLPKEAMEIRFQVLKEFTQQGILDFFSSSNVQEWQRRMPAGIDYSLKIDFSPFK